MLTRIASPEIYSRQESYRYYLYSLCIVIGVPKMLVVWYYIQAADPFARIAYPVLAIYCAWALSALIKANLSLKTVERATLIVLGIVWLGRAIYMVAVSPEGLGEAVQAIYLSYILFCVLAYVMFENATALKFSISIFVISLVISLSQISLINFDKSYLESLQFQAYLAVIIGGIHALSYVKTELSESRAKADMLERIAYKDSLTGLNNRRRVYEALRNNLVVAERYERPLSIILLDIDHFKHINDTYGHDVGDLVLKEFATLLSPLLRKTDVLGRWGGEEFLIVCHETPLEEVARLAERLCKIVASHNFPKVNHVTASFGAVSYSAGLNSEDMLKSADILLYEAKNAGRNQVKSQQLSPQRLLQLPS